MKKLSLFLLFIPAIVFADIDQFEGSDLSNMDQLEGMNLSVGAAVQQIKGADHNIIEENIDTGQWLTTITTPDGSGLSFAVEDARYFTDGMGLIPGDVIKTQAGQHARITRISYGTNPAATLTVNTSISWTQGEGLALDYNGTKPDIGAIEYVPLAPPLPSDLPTLQGAHLQ